MCWPVGRFLVPGDNEVVLHVEETTDPTLPRGKQTHLPFPHTIFYPPFSGIWQPVWLESTGPRYLTSLATVCVPDRSGFSMSISVSQWSPGAESESRTRSVSSPARVAVRVRLLGPDGRIESEAEGEVTGTTASMSVSPEGRHEWTPANPVLYRLEVELLENGLVVDTVDSLAGLRTVSVSDGRFLLNDRPFYPKLALYQPYYPGGWAAALRDEDFRRDVELAQTFGFNGIRVHQSQADPRFLYWCDRLGLLVWSEMPSAFPFACVDRPAFLALLEECVARDSSHPCIVTWVLFNESWGVSDVSCKHDTRSWVREMVSQCRSLDPSRPVIDNSGFDHVDTDILDVHHYLASQERVRKLYAALASPESIRHRWWRNLYAVLPSRFCRAPLVPGVSHAGQPVMISECGGHGFGPHSSSHTTLLDSLRQVIELLAEQPHVHGFCYTQLFDIAQERNGLADFERTPKIDPESVRELLARLPR